MTGRFGILSGIVAILILLSPHALAQDAGIKAIDTVLLEGNASIGTKAPSGWTPVRNPMNLGLCVAYVLDGHTFDDSPSVIYPRLVGGTVEDLVKASADQLKQSSPAFSLEAKEDYRSRKGLTFAIRYFLNGPSPNAFEAVGYLEYKDRILLVVYSSPVRESFDEHSSGFFSALDNVIPYTTEMSALSGSCLVPKN